MNIIHKTLQVAFASVLLIGCDLKDHSEDLWKQTRDLGIGNSIEPWTRYPHSIIQLEGGFTEYVFGEQGGCQWAYIVDPEKTIVSWKYLSDPPLCRQQTKLGPF